MEKPGGTKLTQPTTYVLRMPLIRRLALTERPQELARFLKFATVGALGMLVDLTTLYVLRSLAGWPLLIAASLSFSLAVTSNFTWNRLWTFPESRTRPLVSQLGSFALINIVGLGINNAVLALLYGQLKSWINEPWSYLLAKVLAIGIVLFWNYGANRATTYKGIQ